MPDASHGCRTPNGWGAASRSDRVRFLHEVRLGRVLVYRWADGENLYAPRHLRSAPDSAGRRFRSLPVAVRTAAVQRIIDLHVARAERGWIAGDLYDGCLIYDSDAGTLRECDLDHYHVGPNRSSAGRMPGSTRFMAPEEFERGQMIDKRRCTPSAEPQRSSSPRSTR